MRDTDGGSGIAGLHLQDRKRMTMRARSLYRIAAVFFVLFAAGHTFGFLSFLPHSADGRAVFDAMNKVHFQERGATFSYGAFYRGFGLSCTVSMILSAFLSWHLGELAQKLPQAIGVLAWAFFAAQVAGFALSLIYFSVGPAMFSVVLMICLGWAAWLVRAPPS
jgi:hypothetical protein